METALNSVVIHIRGLLAWTEVHARSEQPSAFFTAIQKKINFVRFWKIIYTRIK